MPEPGGPGLPHQGGGPRVPCHHARSPPLRDLPLRSILSTGTLANVLTRIKIILTPAYTAELARGCQPGAVRGCPGHGAYIRW